MDYFVEATRKKYRYKSTRGDITTEQLWDLPLKSTVGFDLDTVAKGISREVKAETEESFVTTTANAGAELAKNKLEVVKAIIATKIAESKALEDRRERATKRARILDALDQKEGQALTNASIDELKKQLAELDA
jgi:hypothetical protein